MVTTGLCMPLQQEVRKFGEDMFVVLLGGLHIEMALWSTIGVMMQGAGWMEALGLVI